MGPCTSCARAATGRGRRLGAAVRRSIYLAVWVLADPAAALTIRTVALSDDVAPGTGGASYATFGPVVLNQSGQVAFTATLVQGGAVDASNDLGTWSEGTGVLALVQRQGSPAEGVAGTWDVVIAPPAWNDAGQTAFRASVSGPGAVGVWSEGSGALVPVAVSGTQADGAPAGQSYAGPFSEPTLNDAGQVAYHGSLSGGGVTANDDRAVWAGGAGGPLTMVAREGQAAPGAGASFSDFEGTLINGSGGVAFRATLSDGGTGLFAGPAAGVQLVARNGSAAAGTTGQFANFIAGDWSDQGKVAFHAGLEVGVGGVTAGDDRGVWAGAPGALALVAREGQTAPDTGGRVFETFSGPLINDTGGVLFRGFLDSGTGLFLDEGGALGKVVASGDVAPGTSLGLGDASFAGFTDYALNDHGAVAFTAVLAGALQGVTGANDGSLWVRDPDGVLELIVREGQLFELGLGDVAVVESIDFFGAADARGRGINDRGWVAFGLTFTDGRQGVFAAVPEPGTAALLALGLAAIGLRRRGR